MNFKKFCALVFRAFKNENISEVDALKHIIDKHYKDVLDAMFFGITIGGFLVFIVMKILESCL